VVAFRRDAPITEEEARRNGVERLPDFRVDKGVIARILQEPGPVEEEPTAIAWQTMLAESQGAITDRSQEHLAGSDRGILLLRTIVYGGIQDVLEGSDPMHVIRDPAANHLSGIAAHQEVAPTGAARKDGGE